MKESKNSARGAIAVIGILGSSAASAWWGRTGLVIAGAAAVVCWAVFVWGIASVVLASERRARDAAVREAHDCAMDRAA